MIRIDRNGGFVPASSLGMPAPVRRAPAARAQAPCTPRRVLAQTVVMSPEQIQAQRYLDEAREQLASVEANMASLSVAMGLENAQLALEEARASVALYETQRAGA